MLSYRLSCWQFSNKVFASIAEHLVFPTICSPSSSHQVLSFHCVTLSIFFSFVHIWIRFIELGFLHRSPLSRVFIRQYTALSSSSFLKWALRYTCRHTPFQFSYLLCGVAFLGQSILGGSWCCLAAIANTVSSESFYDVIIQKNMTVFWKVLYTFQNFLCYRWFSSYFLDSNFLFLAHAQWNYNFFLLTWVNCCSCTSSRVKVLTMIFSPVLPFNFQMFLFAKFIIFQIPFWNYYHLKHTTSDTMLYFELLHYFRWMRRNTIL